MTLIDEINEIPGSRKDLRKFGLTMGIFLGVFGFILLWRGRNDCVYWLAAGAVMLFLSFCFAALLGPVQKAWMTLAVLMGWVMSRVILCVLFFLIVTPLGFIVRLTGKDLLNEKFKSEGSYWLDHAPQEKNSCKNQF